MSLILFLFQKHSALVHLASNTVQLLQCKTLRPNFLSVDRLWSHNSPELYTRYSSMIMSNDELQVAITRLNKVSQQPRLKSDYMHAVIHI